MKLNKPSPWIPFFLLSVFFLLMVRQVLLHCSSYYDLGIYTEALRNLDFAHLNPFIPGRNIHIFNDHFDPILIPVSFLKFLLPPTFLGMLIDFLAIASCWFPLRLLRDRGKLTPEIAVFSYAYLILNQATTDAILTPFHPTTWAFLPLICVFTFYLLENFKAMMISLVFLFACREEFPLLGVMLGFVLLFDKKKGVGFGVLALSLAWSVFAFGVRPHVFRGEYANYGSVLIMHFFENPMATFKSYLNFGMVKMVLSRVVPLLLLLSLPSLIRNFNFSLKILFIGAPMLAIRFISGQWGFHYGTAAIIIFYFAFFRSLSEAKPSQRKMATAWFLLFVIFMSPVIKKAKDLLFSAQITHETKNRCVVNESRLFEIEKAEEWIAKSGKQKILVENHLSVTQILASDKLSQNQQAIYIVGGLTSAASGPFEVVMVEKPLWGDAWPVGDERIKELIEIWKKDPAITVITDNEYVFLATGEVKIDR